MGRSGKHAARRRDRGGPEEGGAGARGLVAAVLLLLLLASAALGGLTFVPRRAGVDEIAYEQHGEFHYEADVARSAAYPDGRVDTGDPVYLRLVEELTVRFRYHVHSAAPVTIAATAGMSARVTDPAGEHVDAVVAPEGSVAGDEVVVEGTLDLPALRAPVARFESLTGARGGSSLEVLPRVKVTGTVGGVEFADALEPRLVFEMDSSLLRLDAAVSPSGPDDVLRPVSAGSVPRPGGARTPQVVVLGTPVDLMVARAVAGAGVAVCLLGLLVIRARARRAAREELMAEAQDEGADEPSIFAEFAPPVVTSVPVLEPATGPNQPGPSATMFHPSLLGDAGAAEDLLAHAMGTLADAADDDGAEDDDPFRWPADDPDEEAPSGDGESPEGDEGIAAGPPAEQVPPSWGDPVVGDDPSAFRHPAPELTQGEGQPGLGDSWAFGPRGRRR